MSEAFEMPNDEISPLPYEFSRPSEMLALEPPEPIINDLLFTNTNNVLFGASNAFKSFLAVDITCHVANGRNWHGSKVIEGGVIYVAGEGSYGVQRLRIPGWHKHHGIEFTDAIPIRVVSVNVLLDVPEEQAAERLHRTGIAAFGKPTRLYVFDVLKRSMKGSESDDKTIAAVIATQQHLLRLADGSAILTLTHTGWADQNRTRGHTDYWGSCDTRLKAEGDKENQTTVLEVERHKDAEGGQSWGFQLEETVVDEKHHTLVPVIDDQVLSAKSKKGERKMKEGGPQWTAMEAFKEAIENHGVTPPASNHIPANVKAIKRETWDNYAQPRFKAMYDTNVRSSRMNSAITALIGKHVQGWGDWLWIP
jgi:hypothetical protein